MVRARQVVGLLLVLFLTACGAGDARPAGDGPGDRDALHDGLAAHFAGDHPEARKQDAADCFAEELTDRTSPDRLRDAGVLDADGAVVPELPVLPEDVAVDWAAAQLACSDFVVESTRAQVDVTKGEVDARRYADCLRGALTEAELRAAVVDTLTGDWAGVDLARLGRAQTGCADEATHD